MKSEQIELELDKITEDFDKRNAINDVVIEDQEFSMLFLRVYELNNTLSIEEIAEKEKELKAKYNEAYEQIKSRNINFDNHIRGGIIDESNRWETIIPDCILPLWDAFVKTHTPNYTFK